MMLQAKLLAEQLLGAIRELILEVRELCDAINHKNATGGE